MASQLLPLGILASPFPQWMNSDISQNSSINVSAREYGWS